MQTHRDTQSDKPAGDGEAPKRPVGVSSELWSYEVAGGSKG